MEKIRRCRIHGDSLHTLDSTGRWRCKKCRVEAVQKRRALIKEKAIQYKGEKCSICGYNKYIGALEFHHLNPNKKDFGIGQKGCTRCWEKVKEELDKCILVCANCHREIHAGIIQLLP